MAPPSSAHAIPGKNTVIKRLWKIALNSAPIIQEGFVVNCSLSEPVGIYPE